LRYDKNLSTRFIVDVMLFSSICENQYFTR